MITGIRVEGVNSVLVGSGGTCPAIITVPTGKTFVLTDVSMVPTHGVDANLAVAASAAVVGFYDVVSAGATACSGTTAAKFKLGFDLQMESAGGSAVSICQKGVSYHFTNGPEFSNGITVETNSTQVVGTGCIWVAGVLR